MSLQEALRQMRMEISITQIDLATKLNKSFLTVNRWENGKSFPSRENAKKILEVARTFNVSKPCYDYLNEMLMPDIKRRKSASTYGFPDIDREFLFQLADGSANSIYVIEAGTYNLLYANRKAEKSAAQYLRDRGGRDAERRLMEQEDKRCFHYFGGNSKPCPFCPLAKVSKDEYTDQLVTIPETGRKLHIHAKLVKTKGRDVYAIYLTDLTEKSAESAGSSGGVKRRNTMDNKKTILVVEDEAINRKILKKFLSETYEIVEANNGVEAWEFLKLHSSDIAAVLLDIKMPVMDGYAVLKKMHEANMDELPVIVITGSGDEESEQKALNAGAWDFITKPFNPKTLLTRLNNVVARSRLAGLERLQYLSEHDELTGLYSRQKMFAKTTELIKAHSDVDFLFIRVDIDHFSLFNTSFGEQEGNSLLKFIAERIKNIAGTCRYSVCGRMNADVFCVCASCSGNPDKLNEKIEQLQNDIFTYRNDYRLELSVGVCRMNDRTLSADDYYLHSNIAAQECKNQYDKHIAFYDEASGKRLEEEISISGEMQSALDNEQFVIYLQPKFDLTTDKACGAEALVRWKHPEKGLISPGLFIPVFERNGLISKLDYYVWKKTCKLLRGWLNNGVMPFPVSVNISRVSLYNPQLTTLLTGLVNEYMIPVELLQLEITESAYMTNPDLMKKTIAALHKAGFTILMDDFGSGYSSLNTLKEIEMDVLKVDMKFLPVGEDVGRAEVVLSSVIKMANWLGMRVVVEGVENRQQRDFLEGAGCECVQGYFYSKPVPSGEYEKKYVMSGNSSINTEEMGAISSNSSPRYNQTILVIDDNEFDRAVLWENFKQYYHIQMCESAEEALAFLSRNKNKVRLILVDNVMSGMSGLEFLRYCREDSDLNVIPKIMITSNDTVADQVEAFNAGAYDYITKPFQKEIVVARVKHIMEVICNTTLYNA